MDGFLWSPIVRYPSSESNGKIQVAIFKFHLQFCQDVYDFPCIVYGFGFALAMINHVTMLGEIELIFKTDGNFKIIQSIILMWC